MARKAEGDRLHDRDTHVSSSPLMPWDGKRDSLVLYLDRTFGVLPSAGEVGTGDFPLTFRTLTQADLDQKAWVHSQTWRQTYRGLLPVPLLQLVSADFAKNVTLRHHDFDRCLLAFAGPRVIGYAEWVDTPRSPFVDPSVAAPSTGNAVRGASDDGTTAVPSAGVAPAPPVELAAIYLLDRYQHRGIGTRLFREAMRRAGDPARVMLWVQDRNTAAQRFYRHLGFRPTGQIQSEDDGRIVEQAWLLDTRSAGRGSQETVALSDDAVH